MSDDAKKPDPMDDLKKGIGLLFRAAKTAAEQIGPLSGSKLEKAVVSGVKEVGRAIENVTDQIDRQVFGGKGTIVRPEDTHEPPPPTADAKPVERDEREEEREKKDSEEEPKGPRVI